MSSYHHTGNPHAVFPSEYSMNDKDFFAEKTAFANRINSIQSLWASITSTTKLFVLITILGISLYYPLMLGLDTEHTLEGSLTANAVRTESVNQIFLVSFTIMIPVLLDNFLDFVYYGFNIEIIERFVLVGSIFVSFCVQFAASNSPQYSSIFCITYEFQIFIWGSSAIISFHRMLPVFKLTRTLVTVSLFYIGCCCNIYRLVHYDPNIQILASICSYSSMITYFLLFLYTNYLLLKRWWLSGYSFLKYINSIPDAEFSSLIIIYGVTIVSFTLMILILILGVADGLENIPASYIFGYTLTMIVVNIVISLVSGRMLKISLSKLYVQLETKRTFFRYDGISCILL